MPFIFVPLKSHGIGQHHPGSIDSFPVWGNLPQIFVAVPDGVQRRIILKIIDHGGAVGTHNSQAADSRLAVVILLQ